MTALTLVVKVKPGCRRPGPPRWEPLADGSRALHLDVNAPPVDGKANAAVCARLAELLNVPKSALTLTHGTSGRLKRLVLEADAATCARVQDWLAALGADAL